MLSHVRLFAIPWTVVHQAPLSMEFSGVPFPTPDHLPEPGIEPTSLHWQADSLALCYLGSPDYRSVCYIKIFLMLPKSGHILAGAHGSPLHFSA